MSFTIFGYGVYFGRAIDAKGPFRLWVFLVHPKAGWRQFKGPVLSIAWRAPEVY